MSHQTKMESLSYFNQFYKITIEELAFLEKVKENGFFGFYYEETEEYIKPEEFNKCVIDYYNETKKFINSYNFSTKIFYNLLNLCYVKEYWYVLYYVINNYKDETVQYFNYFAEEKTIESVCMFKDSISTHSYISFIYNLIMKNDNKNLFMFLKIFSSTLDLCEDSIEFFWRVSISITQISMDGFLHTKYKHKKEEMLSDLVFRIINFIVTGYNIVDRLNFIVDEKIFQRELNKNLFSFLKKATKHKSVIPKNFKNGTWSFYKNIYFNKFDKTMLSNEEKMLLFFITSKNFVFTQHYYEEELIKMLNFFVNFLLDQVPNPINLISKIDRSEFYTRESYDYYNHVMNYINIRSSNIMSLMVLVSDDYLKF